MAPTGEQPHRRIMHSGSSMALPRLTTRSILARWAVAAVMSLGVAQAALAADTTPLPASVFFNDMDIDGVQLSPSGRWIAMTTAHGGKRHVLVVVDLKGEVKPVMAAGLQDADIRDVNWLNDDRLLFSTIDFHRGAGDQKYNPGLFTVKRDGTEVAALINAGPTTQQTGTNIHNHDPLSNDHALLFVPRGDGDEIIVGEWVFDNRGNVTGINPQRMNVVTRHLVSLALGAPDHAMEWHFDAKGEPRLAVSVYEGVEKIWWRASGKTEWTLLSSFPTLDSAFEPLFIDGADRLYVSAATTTRGTDVVKRFDFATGRPEPKAVVETPGFDFGGHLLVDETGTKVQGVEVNTDAQASLWFDADMKALQDLVDAKLPGRVNTLVCRQCRTTGAVLVMSHSDQEPGEWWAYWPVDKKWQSIGRSRPAIVPREMAQLDFHRTQARDGEDLPIWVTTPRLPKGAPPPPAVILVHGGPNVRGTSWEWNPQAQFLASRGYAVIEPEYRGSNGYGSEHERAGWKKWATTMQDDVADAVKWAVGQKMIDPKRVCIAGASYGGYAALMGPIRYPDLYRCAVAWAGVSDPRFLFDDTWQSDLSDEGRRYTLPTTLGDPKADAALLADASAVDHAAALKVPVLLAYGGKDVRVPIKHGTEMRAALHAAGNDPEWIVYDDEMHGWLQGDSNIDFWTRVEAFLAKNDR